MTKFILLAALAAMCTTASATDIKDQTTKRTTIYTYRGAKASSNPNNPCKGIALFICGKKEVVETTGGYENITYDAYGNIIDHRITNDKSPGEGWEEEKLHDNDNPLHVSDGDWEIVWGNGNN